MLIWSGQTLSKGAAADAGGAPPELLQGLESLVSRLTSYAEEHKRSMELVRVIASSDDAAGGDSMQEEDAASGPDDEMDEPPVRIIPDLLCLCVPAVSSSTADLSPVSAE